MAGINEHKYDGSFDPGYDYKGLVIHAGEGVHEYVFDYLQGKFDKDVKVLVLGSGTGSFDARLFDSGFQNITTMDINTNNYQYQNDQIKFISADLNKAFASKIKNKFDVIIAIEIIEHLHSTPNFLKHCRKLLTEKGSILITSPNPRSYASRWKFLLAGYHNGFQGVPQLYEHINPIHIDILRHHCYFNDLKIAFLDSFDHHYPISLPKRVVRKVLSGFLFAIDSIKNANLKQEQSSILFLELVPTIQNHSS